MKTEPHKGTTNIQYKGFGIIDDNIYGFSLIDTNGNWACSMVSIDRIRHQADEILRAIGNDDFTPMPFTQSV